MDLQELKQTWSALGQQLSQSEVYNRRILREMMTGRTRTTFENLRRGGVFNLVCALFFAAVIIPAMYSYGIGRCAASFYMLEAVCMLGVVMVLCRLRVLSRFDVAVPPVDLLQNVTDYKKCYVREMVLGMPVAVIAICVAVYVETGFAVGAMFFLVLGAVCGVACGYYGWLKHKGTMAEIERNLAELKELE